MKHSTPQKPPINLNLANLHTLPNDIVRPTYDRTRLRAGILHIGVGNFHRAHQAWYLHRLMQSGNDHDWAIIGAGVRKSDRDMREKMRLQDFLTTLIELAPDTCSTEVTGAMIDYLPVEESNGSLIAGMAQQNIRIVSLTVTEGGYYINSSTNALDVDHPDIVHDIENPTNPRTVFGAMIESLRLRRERGYGPFTGLCCDNLQSNGDILRKTVVSLAKRIDSDLAEWIDGNCTFPNSMVDCIVPATGKDELLLARTYGVDDLVPVTHENFRQWVIEDQFCAGRPNWEKVGVVFSDDVQNYEKMKIGILNGGHQIVAVPAELLSIETIAGSIDDDVIKAFFLRTARQEIIPHIDPVLEFSPESYLNLIYKRFSNPKILDTTRRVAFDGSSRHPGFILPNIRAGLAKGTPIDGLALVQAAWARMCAGHREDGSIIEPNDPHWESLCEKAIEAKNRPSAWLGMEHIYGDLAQHSLFSESFCKWLELIWRDGVRSAMKAYCND